MTSVATMTTMRGSVVDLSGYTSPLPDRLILDSNVAVHVLLASGLNARLPPSAFAPDSLHIRRLVGDIHRAGSRAFVTPTVMTEVLHVIIRAGYQHLVRTLSPLEMQLHFGRVLRHWSQLYKLDGSILTEIIANTENLPDLMALAGVIFIDPAREVPDWPGDFLPELLQIAKRYGLDSNDARILLEAQSLGIPHIVTLDRDLQRSAPDFTVYTWL